MFGAEENPAAAIDEDGVRVYLDALKGMFLVEEVPGWVPPARNKRRFTVYARALNLLDDTPLLYYRDDSGLEADAVVQLADGRWAAFEFKVSEDKVAAGAASLRRLREKVCSNPRSRTRQPEFMAVIVGNGEYAREVEDGIYAIPIRVLGAQEAHGHKGHRLTSVSTYIARYLRSTSSLGTAFSRTRLAVARAASGHCAGSKSSKPARTSRTAESNSPRLTSQSVAIAMTSRSSISPSSRCEPKSKAILVE